MFIYIGLIIILILQGHILSRHGRKYDKMFMILSYIEILLIAGFRIAVGGDSEWYVENFVTLSNLNFADVLIFQFEEGFDLFCYFVSKISRHPQTIIFASTALINALVLYYIYKKCRIPWLGVVFYLTFMFFFANLNMMRFAIGCSILLYSNKYILERKPLKFLLVLLLAISFHTSTFFYALLYVLYPMKLNKKNIVLVCVIFYVVSKSLYTLLQIFGQFNGRYVSYADDSGEFYQSAFANLLMFIIQALVFFYCVKINKTPLKKLMVEDKLYTTSLFMALVMSAVAIDIMIFTRFLTMFAILEVVYLPNLMWRFYRRRLYYQSVFVILIITLCQVVVILTYRPEWYEILPYKNILLN